MGYEVYPVVDAVGGTSPQAHRAGLERIVQTGAQPISWVSLACELQRDWARLETVPDIVDIVLNSRLLAGSDSPSPIAAPSDLWDPPGGDTNAGHRWRPRPLAIAGPLAASTTN